MSYQVEHIARAFYDAQDDAKIWENEPEILKNEFRMYALDAIALFERQADARLPEGSARELVEFSDAA